MAALALLANWVRVYTIIEAGYLSNMRNYLVSVSHYWFGWGVFAVALIGFFWLTTWLTPATGPAPPPKEAAITPPPAADDRAELRGAGLAIVLLAILPALSLMARSAHPPAPLSGAPFVVLPPPWSASPPAFDSAWWPDFAGADDTEYLQVQKNAGSPRRGVSRALPGAATGGGAGRRRELTAGCETALARRAAAHKRRRRIRGDRSRRNRRRTLAHLVALQHRRPRIRAAAGLSALVWTQRDRSGVPRLRLSRCARRAGGTAARPARCWTN